MNQAPAAGFPLTTAPRHVFDRAIHESGACSPSRSTRQVIQPLLGEGPEAPLADARLPVRMWSMSFAMESNPGGEISVLRRL